MKTGLKSGVSRVVRWIRETWAELDYAQHRMIELQLGIPPLRVPPGQSELEELEHLYALPAREPGPTSDS
jgi:hypothetical protein